MDGSRLTAIIPAYCEADTIGRIVIAAKTFCEVIVIDDHSPDATGATAAAAGAVVFRNTINKGYDASLARGFREARDLGFDFAVTMDADGEHDPALLSEFKRALVEEGYALVLGIRPRKQRFAEVVMGAYVKLRFGVDDVLCGMKGYRLAELDAAGKTPGYENSIGTEPALTMLRRKTPFAQIPVRGTRRKDAPRFGSGLIANWRILRSLGRAIWRDLVLNLGA